MTVTRRQMLQGMAALPLLAAAPQPPSRVRVVLLGTKGGPTPSPLRAAPATLIEIDGRGWIIDCGNGVGVQLARAQVRLPQLERIFITHNHSDHVADVGTLIELAWSSGLTTPVTVHGPPPIREIVRHQLAALSYDMEVRMREEGRAPLGPLVHVEERSIGGLVLRDGPVTVTSALVDHETVRPAFAYRFDTPQRSIVISGDTRYSQALVALAKGADLLIHEAIYAPSIPALAGENAPKLEEHLRLSHTVAEDVGRVATAAGVRKLVLSHLVGPGVTDEMWIAAVRKTYAGEVLVGRDLLEV